MSDPATVTQLRRGQRSPSRATQQIPEGAVSVRLPQMCQMLGIGTTKANELVRSGAVKSVLLGKTRLISVQSIRALVADKEG